MRQQKSQIHAALFSLVSLCLLAGSMALATPRGAFESAFRWEGELPDEIGGFFAPPRLTLEAISGTELTGDLGSGLFDLGRWQGPDQRVELPAIRTEVTRRVPSLWRLRVDGTVQPASLDVRYTLVALNGHLDHLSHVDRPTAEIGARIDPLRPSIVERGDHTALVEGGMVLTLTLDETRQAGTYAGSITVTIHHL